MDQADSYEFHRERMEDEDALDFIDDEDYDDSFDDEEEDDY